jgi:sugar transferase (PEP-CTERM system associated)
MMGKTLLILMVGDAFIAMTVHFFGLILHFNKIPKLEEIVGTDLFNLIVFVGIVIVTTALSELYSEERNFTKKEISLRILASIILSFLILSAMSYFGKNHLLEKKNLFFTLVMFGCFQFVWHNRYSFFLKIPGVAQKVLIVGVGPFASQIEKTISKNENNWILTGFIQPEGESIAISHGQVLGTTEALMETVVREKVHKIVISMGERRGILPIRDILKCKLKGIAIVDGLSFYEQLTGKLMVENINPSWFVFSDGFRLTPFMRSYKRMFDLIFSTFGILVTLPLLPLVALAIKVTSPGPVLFKQVRVGNGEKPFLILKFRTMKEDAEKMTGAVWAQENDPRVTPIGKFLRKTRLDEIPQLFNVIKGDMSFVGPRPERPEFVEKLDQAIPYYSNRHCVKPGITGWAQVKYPYGASEKDALEKLRFDLFYIKNYTLSLDLLIILETIKVILFGRGGR